MNFKYLIITFFSLSLLFSGLPKNIQKKVDKEIIDTFEVENFTLEPFQVPSDVVTTLPADFSENSFFKILNNDKHLGYAYISKAPSKTDDFDYLVLLNKDLVITKTKVLIYREDYGGEIGSKRWLKQFIGKNTTDELIYQDNIVAISGATISVRSMTKAVNDLLASLRILHSKNLL